MKKYAILVGNSQFPEEKDKKTLPNLVCPENDVDGLAQVLASENAEFEVIALKNKPHYEIQRELQRTVKALKSDDLLLFYYSGHGKPNDAGQLYLTTFDTAIADLETSAIHVDKIYNILNTNPRCARKVIILDCCFSGAAAEGFRGAVSDQLQQLNHSARGTYLMTSSTRNQQSKENAKEGYGIFTKYLISGLKSEETDKNGTGWISMDDWFDYVQSRVVAENPGQLPTMSIGGGGVQGGKLFIAKSGKDSRKERAEKIRVLLLKAEENYEEIAELRTEALKIARAVTKDLSALELAKDALLSDLLAQKLTPVSFIRQWDKLDYQSPASQRKIFELVMQILNKYLKITISFTSQFSENRLIKITIMFTLLISLILPLYQFNHLISMPFVKFIPPIESIPPEPISSVTKTSMPDSLRYDSDIKQAKVALSSENEKDWTDAIERLQFENDLDADTLFLLGDRLAKLNPKDGNNLKEACEWFEKAAYAGNEEGKKAIESKVCKNVL